MKKVFLIWVLLAGIAAPVIAGLVLSYLIWWSSPGSAGSVTVEIEKNMTAKEIARTLDEKGLFSSPGLFLVYVRLTGTADDLKAGSYTLELGTPLAEIVKRLSSATATDRRITLLEGWGIREMGEYLVAQGALKNVEEWYEVVGTPPSVAGSSRQIPGLLQPSIHPNATLEGFLFPDTYRIAVDASAMNIADTLHANFYRRTEEFGSVAYDTLILASILEREVRSDEDRAIVADLFLRRLAEGMALQADSTVNYVTGKKTPALSAEDRDLDSPWNTYQNPGLPPTPISNPSLSSIRAVLHPTPNPYVYFLTDAEGRVHYARTLEEHVANKRRYLP